MPPARPAHREEARREAPAAPRPPQQRSEPPRRPEPPRLAEPARFERDDFDTPERDEPPRSFTIEEIEIVETVEFSIREVPEEPRQGSPEEGPRKDGRRRRRRRRGRGRSGDRPASEQREPEVWDVDSAPAGEAVEEADDVELLSRPAPTERSEEGRRDEEKGRRRRRRRRGGRRNAEARESGAGAKNHVSSDRARTSLRRRGSTRTMISMICPWQPPKLSMAR